MEKIVPEIIESHERPLTPEEKDRDYVDIKGAAQIFDVSEKTARRYIAEGEKKGVKVAFFEKIINRGVGKMYRKEDILTVAKILKVIPSHITYERVEVERPSTNHTAYHAYPSAKDIPFDTEKISENQVDLILKNYVKNALSNYVSVHRWLRNNFGKATRCENTDCMNRSKIFHWANLVDEYTHTRLNFAMLCHICHSRFDQRLAYVIIDGKIFDKRIESLISTVSRTGARNHLPESTITDRNSVSVHQWSKVANIRILSDDDIKDRENQIVKLKQETIDIQLATVLKIRNFNIVSTLALGVLTIAGLCWLNHQIKTQLKYQFGAFIKYQHRVKIE